MRIQNLVGIRGFTWAHPKVLPSISYPSFRTLTPRSSLVSLPNSLTLSSSAKFTISTYQSIKCELSKPRSDRIAEWVSNNDAAARNLPIFVGGASLLSVLINRAVSGIPPVSDASSSQSRADLLTLGLAVTNILAGLVWLTIKPKPVVVVVPDGVDYAFVHPLLPKLSATELIWVWDSLRSATCTRSLVIVYDNTCILQYGVASIDVNAEAFVSGSLYLNAIKSGTQSYLANLSLYPGRSQLPFLPPNTQAVILQPIGDRGIAVIGGDVIRGYTASDQGWISLVAEKIDSAVSKSTAFNKNNE